jgi:hypothetical protein
MPGYLPSQCVACSGNVENLPAMILFLIEKLEITHEGLSLPDAP